MTLFPETRMLAEAKESPRRAHRLVIELLIFLLLFTIASTMESVILTPATVAATFTNPAYHEFLEEAAQTLGEEGLTGYIAGIETLVQNVMSTLPDWYMALQLYLTAAVIIVCLFYCRKIEKRSLASLGLHKRGAVLEYLAGMGIGLAMFSAAVLICVLSGHLSLSVVEKPRIGWIIVFLVGFIIQGMSEEVLCRGYLMVSLSRGCPVWAAIAVNALIFAALHLGNAGIAPIAFINLILFGVFASMYALRRGSLWGIAAIHTVWNFVQGNLYGILVSGTPLGPSFLSAKGGEGRVAELFTGGDFGLEGGIGVTIVQALAIGVLLLIPTKKSELAPPPAQPEGETDTYTVS